MTLVVVRLGSAAGVSAPGSPGGAAVDLASGEIVGVLGLDHLPPEVGGGAAAKRWITDTIYGSGADEPTPPIAEDQPSTFALTHQLYEDAEQEVMVFVNGSGLAFMVESPTAEDEFALIAIDGGTAIQMGAVAPDTTIRVRFPYAAE